MGGCSYSLPRGWWMIGVVNLLGTFGFICAFCLHQESTRQHHRRGVPFVLSSPSRTDTAQTTGGIASTSKGVLWTAESNPAHSNAVIDAPICTLCQQSFHSRNALFRHLRTENCGVGQASSWNNTEPSSSIRLHYPGKTMKRQSFAICFGYYCQNSWPSSSTSSLAETSGDLVEDAFIKACKLLIPGLDNDSEFHTAGVVISGAVRNRYRRTQASLARLRSRALQQDNDCPACADVVVLSVRLPPLDHDALLLNGEQQPYSPSGDNPPAAPRFLPRLMGQMRTILVQTTPMRGIEIKLLSCKWLGAPPTKVDRNNAVVPFHAERSCTQYVYHYWMPLRWLPEGDTLATWIQRNDNNTQQQQRPPPPSNSLRRFKQILRSAESIKPWTATDGNSTGEMTTTTTTTATARVAQGRFGALGCKVRRPWHNFADPSLRGDASPNHGPVWRVLDRARIIFDHGTMSSENAGVGDDVAIAIEFRGDAFLQQQIRRIVGTAVAAVHGWLPDSIFHQATQPDVGLTEMPLAPPGRIYLAGTRFHFEEARRSGRLIFESDSDGQLESLDSLERGMEWIQQRIWSGAAVGTDTRHDDASWLRDVQGRIAPRIVDELNGRTHAITVPFHASTESPLVHVAPAEYEHVLGLLRATVAAGEWPETSVARSSVIRGLGKLNALTAGSFTVVNPRHDVFSDHTSTVVLPLGNKLFPELTKAVFDLEEILAVKSPRHVTRNLSEQAAPRLCARTSSTHCAINCNAEFTPHVDSGRGAGQNTSMIVGLGDYQGGELIVEGNGFNIRYEPLEFDGWRLRHWTKPFTGERFSLVWFTPSS